MSVNSCNLSRNSWLLSCGNCKRSANGLLIIPWTRRCLLLPGERRKTGTKNELWTVCELAIKSYVEPMLPTCVLERVCELKYRIRGYEDLPPAGTDSRARATTQKASPSSGRFTELDGCLTIIFMMTPMLRDICKKLFQIWSENSVLVDNQVH